MPSDPAMGGIISKVYEVNVFGVVRVTNGFLPLLRKAPAAMIVNITSRIGSLADTAITKLGTQFVAVSCSQRCWDYIAARGNCQSLSHASRAAVRVIPLPQWQVTRLTRANRCAVHHQQNCRQRPDRALCQ